jgi:PAS domain S-box-containing protein
MSDNSLNLLFEASPDAILLLGSDGTITLVNRQLELMLGYDRTELFGQPIEILIPERFHENHVGHRNRFIQAPAVRPMGAGRNLLARRKDGSEIPVDIMLSPVLSPIQNSGHANSDSLQGAVVATMRDATERVRTESRLSASEALFKSLFDQAPDAIIAVDRTGKIARANRQSEVMFGYSVAELLGQPIEILVPDRYRHKHVGQRQTYIDRPASRPMGAGLELQARRKDGSEVPVDIMLSPVQLTEDGLVISVVRDITERVKAAKALQERAEQLDRSNKELEMFAYVASHDLQEPLRAVASSCQVLERRLGDKLEADTGQFLGFAVDGAKRMQALINDLLAFSRVSRTENRALISLRDPVERALTNLKTKIDETKATISQPTEWPEVYADTTQLGQVFQNLIGNGLKFRNPEVRPHIEIAAQPVEGGWLCSVKDNGIGIEKRYFDKIFTLFQRLHSRDQYPGTGIGLAITKKVIDRHGGKIWIESTPGAGTTFFFTLPSATVSS